VPDSAPPGKTLMRLLRSVWFSAFMGTTALPVAAQGQVELLFVGDFLGKRIWPLTGQRWFGLFSTPSGYRLAPTRIRVEQVPDACAGTSTKVSVDAAAEPYLLLKGLRHLRSGPVDTAFAGQEFFYPGQSLSIKLNEPERWYYLRALGTARSWREGILFNDYRLELHDSPSIDAEGQAIVQLDALTMDNTPKLRWAGDLDRDGRLDLLLQVPIGGYSKRYVLLLSSFASPPKLLQQVATFDLLDC
jgi:hypothetical protein